MKKFIFFSLTALAFAACGGSSETDLAAQALPDSSTVSTSVAASNKQCFLLAEKKDTTTVSLEIAADGSVTGTMDWQPWEKDGAHGTLKGKKTESGELDLMYDYMIEGASQTETKMMKIEGDKLLIKKGELDDPKYNGHMVYKDVAKAKYTETLSSVACK